MDGIGKRIKLVVAVWSAVCLGWGGPVWGETETVDEAKALSNKVVELDQGGRYQEALPMAERALKISEKVLGPEHPYTTGALNNIGILFLDLKDYTRADEYIKKGKKNKLSLAALHLATGKNTEALKILEDIRPRVTSTPTYQIQFYTQEGLGLSGVGRRVDAAASFLKAVRGIEELRSRVAGEREASSGPAMVVAISAPFRGLSPYWARPLGRGKGFPLILRPTAIIPRP